MYYIEYYIVNTLQLFYYAQRVTVKREVTPDGVIAQLQISSAEASDSGAYFCQASNLYGRDQQLVQLLVQGTILLSTRMDISVKIFVKKKKSKQFYSNLEPPQPPNSLETAMVASRSINVKWQHKSQDTTEVTKYILQYKEGDGDYFTIILEKKYINNENTNGIT